MDIKARVKRNKYIYSFMKKLRIIQLNYLPYLTDRCKFKMQKMLRLLRITPNSPFEKLKMIKNKHQGERCFIVATGPSLTIKDLEKLKGETTMSMNTICLAFDKTDWRPTYYGIQDDVVYGHMKEQIDALEIEGKFFSDQIQEFCKLDLLKNDYIFPIDPLHHYLPNNTNYHTKFSGNIFGSVYNGHTITYSLLQIAVYMGFKEIYLLGTDCNYGSDMNHHFINYDHVDPTYKLANDMMIAAYKEAKKYADKHDIKIYNATRGGQLEVFERVDYDTLFEKNNQLYPNKYYLNSNVL